MALPKQMFGFGSALLFIPRGICRSQSFQQWSKDCRKESKKTNSLGIYEAWRLSVNKSNKLRMHLGSASVGMSLEGGVVLWVDLEYVTYPSLGMEELNP